MERLFYPLTANECNIITEGGHIEKHYHLPAQGIPTLLVVVGKTKREKSDYSQHLKAGISVTSLALNPENVRTIAQGDTVVAGFGKFEVIILLHDRLRMLAQRFENRRGGIT